MAIWSNIVDILGNKPMFVFLWKLRKKETNSGDKNPQSSLINTFEHVFNTDERQTRSNRDQSS